MNRFSRFAAASCVLLAGCGDQQLDDCGVGSADPSRNDAFSVAPAAFVEQWRVGGAREGQDLALPAAVAADRRGFAAIPDFQLSEVLIVDPEGEWLGSWTRPGPGPGEVLTPIAVAWTVDGRAVVWDASGSKVVWLGGEGQDEELGIDPGFNAAVIASGQILWVAVHADGAVVARVRTPASREGGAARQERTEYLLRLRPAATAPDTLASGSINTLTGNHSEIPLPGSVGLVAASSPDGRVAVGEEAGRYRIRVIGPDGESRRICRSDAAKPFRSSERGGDVGDPGPGSMGAALAAAPVAEHPHPFGRMFFDADGRLWVQRDRPGGASDWDALYGVAGAEHDVFAPDGSFLGVVSAPKNARLQGARGDRVWALELGPLDEPWLVLYRVAELS